MTKTLITRRSFLKGLLALSASAAIPVELVKAAEIVYSDDTPLQKPPTHILINGKIVPFFSLSIGQSFGDCSNFYNPSGYGYCVVHTIRREAEMPEISLVTDDIYFDFFQRLREFDFEIIYEKLPYTFKGKGWGTSIQTESTLIEDKQRTCTFNFVAELSND